MPVFVVLSLVFLLLSLFLLSDEEKGKKQQAHYPQQINRQTGSLPQRKAGIRKQALPVREHKKLPPRSKNSISTQARAVILDFPRCPIDHQRNIRGQKQVIFYDPVKDCYRCSRGHYIKKNGMPL